MSRNHPLLPSRTEAWRSLLQPLLLILCCVTSPAYSQGTYLSGKWWMDQPYGNDDYNVRQEYLKNVTLKCEDDMMDPSGSWTPQYWVLPDLRVLLPNSEAEYYTLDGWARWYVNQDASEILVTNIQERQFGFYHCHLSDGSTTHVVKKAINYNGPYFGDLWDKYEMNVIIACSAAGAVLLLIIICYLIYMYFERQPTDPEIGDALEAPGDYDKPGGMGGFNLNTITVSGDLMKQNGPSDGGVDKAYTNQAYQIEDSEKLTEL